MDRPDQQPAENPQDPDESVDRLVGFGLSVEAARIYATFMHGGRWPRPSDG